MSDLPNTSFTAHTDTETDSKSPLHETLVQKMGSNINYIKAQLDLIERTDVLAYAALALRDI